MHAIDLGKINGMKAAQATALAKAVSDAATDQKRVDKVAMDAAVADATSQQKEVVKTLTITKWAVKNVKDVVDCPGPALAKLFNSAASGADPESITFGPGQPDGTSAHNATPRTP